MPSIASHLLEPAFLQASITEIKSDKSVLYDLVFGGEERAEEVPHDILMYNVETVDNLQSHFIPPNTAAFPVGEGRGKRVTVRIPHQALKTSINPSDIHRANQLFPYEKFDAEDANLVAQMRNSRLGKRIVQIMKQHQARIRTMDHWMASQAMIGSVAYSVKGEDSFVADFGRPASHHEIITVAADKWTDPTSSIIDPVMRAQQGVAQETNTQVSVAIMHPNVVPNFIRNNETQALLDNSGVILGTMDLTQGYQNAGTMRYYGQMHGIAWWSLGQTLTINGTSVPMIRDGYVEFLSIDPALNNRFVYAPVVDFDGMPGDAGSSAEVLRDEPRQFVKAWGQTDPSTRWIATKVSKFPRINYPGFSYSTKVQ